MSYSMTCPKCGEDCDRDEVDIGVGIMCGPWGCRCGWSDDPEYDSSEGPSPAARAHPNHYVNSQGGMIRHTAISERLKHFGLDGDRVIDKVFRIPDSAESKGD